MKNCFLMVASALAVGCTSQVVMAQSSVTLYGLIEDGIDFVNNSAGKQVYAMRDGTYTGVYGSRWGLLGREDLGGDLAAIFRLEGGFNVHNGTLGQGGREFGRQAYVGVTSGTYGTLLAGRQYDSMVDFLQFSTTGSVLGSYASHATDIDNLSNSYRIDNALKYTSPTVYGLRGSVLMSLTGPGTAAGPRQVPVWSLGGDYSGHGLRFGIAYFHADHPADMFSDGAHYMANTVGAAIGAAGPWSYIGHPDHVDMGGLGATYTWGPVTIAGAYSKARYAHANGTTDNVTFDDYDASVRYMLSSALKLIAGYLYTHGQIGYLGESARYNRIALGANYALSKRTEFYGGIFGQQSGGVAKGASLYQGAGASQSTTDRQVGARIAMITRF
ncbi:MULTISPECIES: porin [Paraburkholderia]|nr:porin [Paraburkholderia podalyriae]